MSVNKAGLLISGGKILTDMKSIKAVGVLTIPTLFKTTGHAQSKVKHSSIK
jgi:predicted glycosyltransferase